MSDLRPPILPEKMLTELQIRESSSTTIKNLTEEEMAHWKREEGARVIRHQNRYWQQVHPGYYSPVHLLARMSAREATRPSLLCWGFRAVLSRDDSNAANRFLPVHIADLADLSRSRLSKKRRYELRRSEKLVRFYELTGPEMLRRQGWDVYIETIERVGSKRKLLSRAEYLDNLERLVRPGRRLILAGLVGERLAGYNVCHCVDGVAYVMESYYATEFRRAQVGIGGEYTIVDICKRSNGVHTIVRGLHDSENAGLTEHKVAVGFPVRKIPAKVYVHPIVKHLLRRFRPQAYYTLVGAPES